MKEECLICSSPLVYLEKERSMECAICHKVEYSKTCCERGHYVCNECHTRGIDAIYRVCLDETSKNPIEILEKMMAMPENFSARKSSNNSTSIPETFLICGQSHIRN